VIKLRVEALRFSYAPSKDPSKDIFRNFSLRLEGPGPFVMLGPSGCGKTTFLKLLGALEKPVEGSIAISGAEGVSFVFQEPRLLPWHTVLENVSLPVKKFYGSAAAERAASFLRLVSLDDKLNAYPAELSGGQQQRAALARAFAHPGSLVLMDEPFQSLDIPLRIDLMNLTRKIMEGENRGLVLVTHDPREAVFLGRRIIVLGQPCRGIVLDWKIDFENPGPEASLKLEQELIAALSG
jgi:NitT/TauT family transport system ATP-binding protein